MWTEFLISENCEEEGEGTLPLFFAVVMGQPTISALFALVKQALVYLLKLSALYGGLQFRGWLIDPVMHWIVLE